MSSNWTLWLWGQSGRQCHPADGRETADNTASVLNASVAGGQAWGPGVLPARAATDPQATWPGCSSPAQPQFPPLWPKALPIDGLQTPSHSDLQGQCADLRMLTSLCLLPHLPVSHHILNSVMISGAFGINYWTVVSVFFNKDLLIIKGRK